MVISSTERQRRETDAVIDGLRRETARAAREQASRQRPYPAPLFMPTLAPDSADTYADAAQMRADLRRMVDTYRDAAGLEPREFEL